MQSCALLKLADSVGGSRHRQKTAQKSPQIWYRRNPRWPQSTPQSCNEHPAPSTSVDETLRCQQNPRTVPSLVRDAEKTRPYSFVGKRGVHGEGTYIGACAQKDSRTPSTYSSGCGRCACRNDGTECASCCGAYQSWPYPCLQPIIIAALAPGTSLLIAHGPTAGTSRARAPSRDRAARAAETEAASHTRSQCRCGRSHHQITPGIPSSWKTRTGGLFLCILSRSALEPLRARTRLPVRAARVASGNGGRHGHASLISNMPSPRRQTALSAAAQAVPALPHACTLTMVFRARVLLF